MAAYSLDLRERVVADVDAGITPQLVAQKYRVSRSWVYKILQFRRDSGSISTRQPRVSHATKLDDALPQLEQLVKERPDATLKELRDQLGLTVGISTIWRALKRLHYTFKKKSYTLPSKSVPMCKFNEQTGKLVVVGYL